MSSPQRNAEKRKERFDKMMADAERGLSPEHQAAINEYNDWLTEVDKVLGAGAAVKIIYLFNSWEALGKFSKETVNG